MKNPLFFTILCLALSIVACGKKSDNTVATDPNAIVVAPVGGPVYPVPPGNGLTLQQYCQYYNGQYSGSICSISQVSYGSQWGFQIGDLNTGLAVYSGQRVSVATTGNPSVLVGGVSQGVGNVSFVASYSGYLSFHKALSFNTYNVQSVQITTCYNAPGQAAVCP